MDPPILTLGKNLNGINIKYDYSKLVTKLYPRGSGSAPSELCLNNPLYYPAGQYLVLDHTDSVNATFRLSDPYSAYAGYKGGVALPAGYYVGMDSYQMYNPGAAGTSSMWPDSKGDSPHAAGFLLSPTDAIAGIFYVSGSWMIPSVALQLQRIVGAPLTPGGHSSTPTAWTTQPRFVVGLWSCTKSNNIGKTQLAGFAVPNQGPLSWCYGNLLSINSELPQWYNFPLQAQKHAITGWMAIVIMPYPTSNKQWSLNDYLAFGAAPQSAGNAKSSYCALCVNGATPKNWMVPTPGEATPWKEQLAMIVNNVKYDVTSQFNMTGDVNPGRYLKSPMSKEPSGGWAAHTYLFYHQLEPYLINWDAYTQYGKIEGTYKDDSLTTQAALMAAGSQYLTSVSQPIMTTSLSAADLYAIDPNKNWAEELKVGGLVKVIDDLTGIEELCVITKIDKQDLTQPHAIDTLTLNNVHLSAQKLMAQLSRSTQRAAKYQQGQTVETPYTVAGAASSSSPASMTFYIRDSTTLTHSVRLTVDAPSAFKLTVDGNLVGAGQTFSGMNEIDVLPYCTHAHNGQPTPGVHTVIVSIT